jgi:glutamate synthase domain-containing protein 2
VRTWFVTLCFAWAITALLTWWQSWFLVLALPSLWFTVAGVEDLRQTRHAVRRNFPVLGRFRYTLEGLRNEIRQYFFEEDDDDNPISREKRGIVYARSKNQLDTLPFGTRHDLYRPGYEWIDHSLAATHLDPDSLRVRVGEHSSCTAPYSASMLNISAMSFGALSRNAILALNRGAHEGGFYHNTGEGGLSPYHLEGGGDVVWQIGTAYFGCRTADGDFDEGLFREGASHPHVKMIEIKLSQGAKPGHGGILPGQKLTEEIAAIRKVPMGADVISPPTHSAFDGPTGLLEFVERLREVSGGKPVGFKLCVGHPLELTAIVKAMVSTGVTPDFITVDGGEGGTGAAPLEFSNSVGRPLVDGLVLTNRVLIGAGLRSKLRVISAGKITSGFHIVRQLALGADFCNAARAMMFSLGCIQALKCNTNRCPVGVATQDPALVRGLVVEDKAPRVAEFHRKTVESVAELLGAAGISDPRDLSPHHLMRRDDDGFVRSYEDRYPTPEPGSLLNGGAEPELQALWNQASPDRFDPVPRMS